MHPKCNVCFTDAYVLEKRLDPINLIFRYALSLKSLKEMFRVTSNNVCSFVYIGLFKFPNIVVQLFVTNL